MAQRISKPVFFISDLHLSAQRPGQLECLSHLLRIIVAHRPDLYILGDLFEQFWIGTDDHADPHPEAMALLAEFSRQGGCLRVLRGNRDFYLNADFAQQTGSTLLEEPFLLALDGQTALLMHGDILCIKDRAYQRHRRVVTTKWVERLFMALPLALRQGVARRARSLLRARASNKPTAITDADEQCARRHMRDYGVHTLIHGHTHRPAVHEFLLDGRAARRIVLGDWYEKDSVLVWQEGHFKLLRVNECLARFAAAAPQGVAPRAAHR